MIFSRGLSQSLYIFPAGQFAPLPFSGWETDIFFTGIIFSEGSNRLRFNSRGFNNHSFQGILIFKNLVIHTPVWVKNGTAQFLVQSCSECLLVLYWAVQLYHHVLSLLFRLHGHINTFAECMKYLMWLLHLEIYCFFM